MAAKSEHAKKTIKTRQQGYVIVAILAQLLTHFFVGTCGAHRSLLVPRMAGATHELGWPARRMKRSVDVDAQSYEGDGRVLKITPFSRATLAGHASKGDTR